MFHVAHLNEMPPIGSLVVFVTGALIVAGIAVNRTVRGFRSEAARAPTKLVTKPFLRNRKHAMLAALERVLPMYRIHAQVAMSALVSAGEVATRRVARAERKALDQMVVDFVLVDPTSGAVIALVEMDERLGDTAAEQAQDALTARAGYTTIRIPASERATIATAQAAVGRLRDDALATTTAVTRLPVATPVRLEGRFHGAR